MSQILGRFLVAKVEFVLVGGLAVVYHGSSLVTRDVDVCCRFTEANLRKIFGAVADINPTHRMRPDIVLPFTEQHCGRGFRILYLKTDLGVVDCLGEVTAVGDFEAVLSHSVAAATPAGILCILDIEALITAKRAMGRPHDFIAVQHPHLFAKRRSLGSNQ